MDRMNTTQSGWQIPEREWKSSGTEVGGVLSAHPGWLETSIDSPG